MDGVPHAGSSLTSDRCYHPGYGCCFNGLVQHPMDSRSNQASLFANIILRRTPTTPWTSNYYQEPKCTTSPGDLGNGRGPGSGDYVGTVGRSLWTVLGCYKIFDFILLVSRLQVILSPRQGGWPRELNRVLVALRCSLKGGRGGPAWKRRIGESPVEGVVQGGAAEHQWGMCVCVDCTPGMMEEELRGMG